MKINIKSLILGILLGGVFFSGISFAAEELIVKPNPYPILIDGKTADVSAYNIDDSTYLKMKDFEKAGLGVEFNPTEKQIEVTTNSVTSTDLVITTPPTDGSESSKDENEYEGIKPSGAPNKGEYHLFDLPNTTWKTWGVLYNGTEYYNYIDVQEYFNIKLRKTNNKIYATKGITIEVDNNQIIDGDVLYYNLEWLNNALN